MAMQNATPMVTFWRRFRWIINFERMIILRGIEILNSVMKNISTKEGKRKGI